MPSGLDIAISRSALKTLDRLPRDVRARIRAAIERYAQAPGGQGHDVRPIVGEAGALRLRVGDWRILFRVAGVRMEVREIRPRGSAYRRQG
jgi:mRNA interferase RelE/StbE